MINILINLFKQLKPYDRIKNNIGEIPINIGFFDALRLYSRTANKLFGGRGLLSDFNTSCMEYCMISSPRKVLYGNGIPHDLKYAQGLDKELYEGLRAFLEENFPRYTRDDIIEKEFDEFGKGIRSPQDCVRAEDLAGIQLRVNYMKDKPESWY
jgi:hypothetical protein